MTTFTATCLANDHDSFDADTWDDLADKLDRHAERVEHDHRWPITFKTNVGVTYRMPVL